MTDLPAVVPALDQTHLIQLAKEVAVDLRDLTDILADYKLTEEQFNRIKESSMFKRVYDATIIEWNSADSIHKRLGIISAMYLEENLPTLAARMVRNDEDLTKTIAAGRLLADLAGISKSGAAAGTVGEKFTININLGGDDKIRIEKDVTPAAPEKIQSDEEGS